jgi:hypothetical protein
MYWAKKLRTPAGEDVRAIYGSAMDATRRSPKCVQCNPEGQRRHTVLAATRQRDARFGNKCSGASPQSDLRDFSFLAFAMLRDRLLHAISE